MLTKRVFTALRYRPVSGVGRVGLAPVMHVPDRRHQAVPQRTGTEHPVPRDTQLPTATARATK